MSPRESLESADTRSGPAESGYFKLVCMIPVEESHRIHSNAYRPEIDGLRAVAVLVVVLFHAGMGFRGGYVGVDVFFVISGFLITTIIRHDLESGEFSLLSFWERRARRILPALFVVTGASAMAGWWMLFPSDLAEFARSLAAQALFCANVVFWKGAGYFGENAEEQPLLHTWSLAVEEQFYLAIPLLLLALFHLTRRRQGLVFSSLLAVFFGSLVLSVWWVNRHPSAAFFSLPSRAWEMALGALVATAPATLKTAARLPREVVAATGLALILGPVFSYTSDTPFPGLAALAPCFGAAAVIWANGDGPTWTGRFLALRPMVFVGLISYSLYLWHWPLLAFGKYQTLAPLSVSSRITLVAVAVLAAVISWRWVETPFRNRAICATRRSILTFAGIGLAAGFALGALGAANAGFPNRFPSEVGTYFAAKKDRAFLNDMSVESIEQDHLMPFGADSSHAPVSLLVWGDSHAMAALPAFDAFAKERNLVGRAATHSSMIPVLAFEQAGGKTWGGTRRFNHAVIDYIKREHIPHVILIGFWNGYADKLQVEPPVDQRGSQSYPASAILKSSLLKTIHELRLAGAQTWVMLQVPIQQFSVPKGLARRAAFGEALEPLYTHPGKWNGITGDDARIVQDLVAAGAKVLDPRPLFLDANNSSYAFEHDGRPLYVDEHHLTTQAAKEYLLPLIRQEFTPLFDIKP